MKAKRRRNVCVLSFITFMVLGGMVGQAGAVCAQADLTGTWYAYGVSGNSNQNGFDSYVRCKIVLNSAGTIVATKSSCKGRDDVGIFSRTLTGVSVRVSTACALTGSFVFSGVRFTIEYGQMAKDKNIAAFAIYQNTNPDMLGMFTAVKQ